MYSYGGVSFDPLSKELAPSITQGISITRQSAFSVPAMDAGATPVRAASLSTEKTLPAPFVMSTRTDVPTTTRSVEYTPRPIMTPPPERKMSIAAAVPIETASVTVGATPFISGGYVAQPMFGSPEPLSETRGIGQTSPSLLMTPASTPSVVDRKVSSDLTPTYEAESVSWSEKKDDVDQTQTVDVGTDAGAGAGAGTPLLVPSTDVVTGGKLEPPFYKKGSFWLAVGVLSALAVVVVKSNRS